MSVKSSHLKAQIELDRQRVIELAQKGLTYQQICKRVHRPQPTIHKWLEGLDVPRTNGANDFHLDAVKVIEFSILMRRETKKKEIE